MVAGGWAEIRYIDGQRQYRVKPGTSMDEAERYLYDAQEQQEHPADPALRMILDYIRDRGTADASAIRTGTGLSRMIVNAALYWFAAQGVLGQMPPDDGASAS
jgi:hypothetical protein